MNKRLRSISVITLAIFLVGIIFITYSIHRLIWFSDIIFFFSFYVVLIVLVVTSILFFVGSNHARSISKEMQKKYFINSILFFIIPLILATSVVVFDQISYANYYTFTVQKWRDASPNERGRLIDSFRRTYDVIGMNLEEVENLLGIPDYDDDSSYIYNLGDYRQAIAMDPYFYEIMLNEADVVISDGIFQG